MLHSRVCGSVVVRRISFYCHFHNSAAIVSSSDMSRMLACSMWSWQVRFARTRSPQLQNIAPKDELIGDGDWPSAWAGDETDIFRAAFPDIEFEDLGDEEVAKDTSSVVDQEDDPKPRTQAIPDDAIVGVDVQSLARDQFIWCVGRAATLGVVDQAFWDGVEKALTEIGEANLMPSELCRLMQGLAYAPLAAPIAEAQVHRLLRAFARHAGAYSDERLMRVIYGYCKLSSKRKFSQQKFLDFAESEVLERVTKMRSWRQGRILQAVWNLPGASVEFKNVLMKSLITHASNMDAEALRRIVPMLADSKFHERKGVVDRLNAAYMKKIYGWQSPELLLVSGVNMVLFDLMKRTVFVAWLLRLCDLAVCLRYSSMTDSTAQTIPEKHGKALSVRCQVTDNLIALKMVDLCIRHEQRGLRGALPPKVLHLLDSARGSQIWPPDGYDMPELPFIYAELRRAFLSLGVLLHPTVYGPYLLELADPLGQVVVEWDASWGLYPPYRRREHEHFVRRKHLHLNGEGWSVLRMPLKEFSAQDDWSSKVQLVDRFVVRNNLQHLRMKA